MILIIIMMTVAFGLAIRPAHAHDQEQPISVTGKERTWLI